MTFHQPNAHHQPIPKATPQRRSDFWSLAIAALLTLAIIALSVAATATTYINARQHAVLQAQHQQQQLEQLYWHTLDAAAKAASNGEYFDCLQLVSEVPSSSGSYARSAQLHEQCYNPLAQSWMRKAKALATTNHLAAAITEVSQIQSGPLLAEAQSYIRAWSEQIIEVAKRHYNAPTNQLTDALNIVSAVPAYSPLYETSQDLYQRWKQTWSQNQRYAYGAKNALETGDPVYAAELASQISDHPFWDLQRDRLLQSAENNKRQLDQIAAEVDALVAQNKLHLAQQKAQALPTMGPYAEKKRAITAEATAQQQQSNWRPVGIAVVAALLVGISLKCSK